MYHVVAALTCAVRAIGIAGNYFEFCLVIAYLSNVLAKMHNWRIYKFYATLKYIF